MCSSKLALGRSSGIVAVLACEAASRISKAKARFVSFDDVVLLIEQRGRRAPDDREHQHGRRTAIVDLAAATAARFMRTELVAPRGCFFGS